MIVSAPQSEENRFDWLDALRGIAALAVMMYHARAILWIGFSESWRKFGFHPDLNAALGYLLIPFSFGYLGVALFFVVSGFSIHYRGARQLAEKGSAADLPLKVFFLKRFTRLYPTYCAALIITMVIDAFLVTRLPILAGNDDHSLWAFLSTLFGLQGILSHHYGSASVFWTLVLEMHLYLVYPVLFHLSRKKGAEWVLIFTLVIQLVTLAALSCLQLPEKWPFWYAGGPLFIKFWFTWTVGFYVAEVISGRAKAGVWLSGYTALVALILGIVATALNYADAAETPLALFMGWLLLAASRRLSYASWSFWLRPLAFCGVVGYCLYCVHLPLLRLTRTFINQGHPSESIAPIFIGALVCLIGALVLFFSVDRWAISWSRSIGKKA